MAKSWLFKTEPSSYSFGDLEADGRTVWDGVRNALARKHLAAVRSGDEVFVYHTGDEKAVIGVARAVSDARPDPADAKLLVVDLEPVRRLAKAVTLATVKANPELRSFPLVRLPRLSVMPVSPAERAALEKLAT
jgi:predicted RNA-binding protein with PUA-like domain